MKVKSKLAAALALFSAGLIPCKSAGQSSSDRPNIVIILADDLGYGDLEVYNDNSKIPTPNLNAMAAAGMRFTDAHSPSSVCTPTRYGLLTGRYAWRTPLKRSVLWSWDGPLIEKNRETLAKMLKGTGYHTACIGKWHLGWRWPGKQGGFVNDSFGIGENRIEDRNHVSKEVDFSRSLGGGPLEAGFDYYFGVDVPNFPPHTYFENDRLLAIPDTLKPESMFGVPGPMVKGWNLAQVMPVLTQRAVSYIQEKGESGTPFFLYLPLTAPHTPIAPTDEFVGKSSAGQYGDYVVQVDFTVGQVMDALRKIGQLDNTIVIFTSDNGSPGRDGEKMSGAVGSVKKYGHNPSGPLRGIKADIWEGGHRVPFIVSWPDKVKKESVSDQLFGLNDLMATIAAITNQTNREYEDSFDFSKVWLGASSERVRQDLVHHSIDGTFAIRKGPWKLILGQGSGGWSPSGNRSPGEVPSPGQLYNLVKDLPESNNLYNDYPEIVAELASRLDLYKAEGFSNPRFKERRK